MKFLKALFWVVIVVFVVMLFHFVGVFVWSILTHPVLCKHITRWLCSLSYIKFVYQVKWHQEVISIIIYQNKNLGGNGILVYLQVDMNSWWTTIHYISIEMIMCHCLHHSHDHSRKKKCIISSSFSVSFITLFSVTVLNKLYQDGAHHNLIPGCLLLHRKYRRMGSSGAHRYLAHTAY